MTRAERIANLAGVIVPFAGVLAAVVLLWNRAVDATDLALLAACYLATAIGITVGFHRLLTHRAFRHPPVAGADLRGARLAVGAGLGAGLGGRSSQASRPHRPRGRSAQPARRARQSGLPGLWHAHVGWLMETQGQADWKRYAPELYEDPAMRRDRSSLPATRARLARWCPTLAGCALHGFTAGGALRGLIWGGLVRIFLVHHVTWSVNSVCHFFGSRRFDADDQSTNVGGWRCSRWGVLASQPPRLPALGRSTACGAQSSTRRAGSSPGWSARAGLERDPDRSRAPAGPCRDRRGLSPGAAAPVLPRFGRLSRGDGRAARRARRSPARRLRGESRVAPAAASQRAACRARRQVRDRAAAAADHVLMGLGAAVVQRRARGRCRSGGPGRARPADRASRRPSEPRCRAAASRTARPISSAVACRPRCRSSRRIA